MHFVIIARDEPTGEARLRHRAAHLDFVADRQGDIVYAGPLIEEGRIVGSLFVFDFPDRAALDAYMAGDPYFTAPIFDSVEVFESRWMVPERESGFLKAEAARLRSAP